MSGEYKFSGIEHPFYFEFKVFRRKKLKSKVMISRRVNKSFPYGDNKPYILDMIENSGLLTDGIKTITREEAEGIVSGAKEYEKEEWDTDESIHDNAIFISLNTGTSEEQLKNGHTASVIVHKGKKTRIPSRDLADILYTFAGEEEFNFLVDKMHGFSIINYPPAKEIFWFLFHLQKGYPTTQGRLNYYYFDSQPANVMNYTTIRVPQERYLEEHDTSIWNAAPIYRDIDNRVLESDLHVALKYPSGTTYPAKVVVKGGYAIVEAEEYGTAIFVIPSKYFFTQNDELDLEMIREYKRFNHSKTVLDRVDDYIRQNERK